MKFSLPLSQSVFPFFSLHPTLPPWLLPPCCLSPLSLPGVVAMARESAQMAGQLAFRGRAPQLKLPQFSSFLPPFSSAQTFGLQLFHAWRAFISLCTMWGGKGGWVGWAVLRSIGAISISGASTQRPEEPQRQLEGAILKQSDTWNGRILKNKPHHSG